MSSSIQLARHESIREIARAERAAAGYLALSSYLAAGVLAVFYLATSLYISSQRLLWFDEVFTVHMARLPDWKTLLDALRHGVDSLPPAYYIVVNLSGKLFGKSDVAVRLPSTLAMVATLLITFDCARRLTNGLHGLIALAIAASPLAGEGFEARSYAIYVMFAALTLWVWSYDWMSRKWGAVCFGLTLFAAVSFHYYAALLLLPYALWELSRWKPGQVVPLKLIAGIVGVALAIALLLPLIMSFSRQFAAGFWSHPSLSELMEIYSHIFVGGLFVLALSIIWMVLTNKKRGSGMVPPMNSAEAIGWLFLCVPLAGFVAAELKTNAFAVRYFLGIVPAIAIAISCCLWRHFHNAAAVSLGIFLLIAGWGVGRQLHTALHPDSVETPGTRDVLAAEDFLSSEGKQYFVLSDPFQFLEVQYYSRHPDQVILLLPADFDRTATHSRVSADPYLHQRVELLLSQYYPLQFWRAEQLRRHASETALIRPAPEVLQMLTQSGLAVENRLSKPVSVLYVH
jgi:hypothetical protein